ncbi:MAG TPA: cupin domain-containing protein [Verrucomicrobiae bacterium]
MKHVYRARGYFTVPDGTKVSPFLNATDAMQMDVPWGALGEMSVASGIIDPGRSSWIHVHPAVAQITYVISGILTVWMKGVNDSKPYSLKLTPGNAAISAPGELFQLANNTKRRAAVLYIVSPSYVFEMVGKKVIHDDSILVARAWRELSACKYDVPALKVSKYEAVARRAESKRRLACRKGCPPAPLAAAKVRALRKKANYLAPDKSEIRLLAEGQEGGLAHCVLPAGKVSIPVRHRTVEELWYVVEGTGKVWRARGKQSRVDSVKAGDSITIPVGVSFQFKAGEAGALKILIATIPRWPGPQEAVPSKGRWLPTG